MRSFKQAGKAAAFRVPHDHDVADVQVADRVFQRGADAVGDGSPARRGGTRLATFRMTNRSPGVASRSRTGSTRESLQAMTRA